MSAQNKSSRIDEWLLQKVYRAAGQPAVRLRLRNGAEVSPNSLPKPVLEPVMRTTCLEFMIVPPGPTVNQYDAGSKAVGYKNEFNRLHTREIRRCWLRCYPAAPAALAPSTSMSFPERTS